MFRCLAVVAAATLLAGAAPPRLSISKPSSHPDSTMPEDFAGKESAAMEALFPGWSGMTELTGKIVETVDDKADGGTVSLPEGARLRQAKKWVADERTWLVVTVDRWTGTLCETAECAPQPTDIAVLELRDYGFIVLGRAQAGRHGGQSETQIDLEPRRLGPGHWMCGARETTRDEEKSQTVLRLFTVESDVLTPVFERMVSSTEPSPVKGGKATVCAATVTSDNFGTSPFPLKVSEKCIGVGKTGKERSSGELWRWDAAHDRYKLHGPPSDAKDSDDDFTRDEDDAK